MRTKPKNYGEFWGVYLKAHKSPMNRAIHYLASINAFLFVGALIATGHPKYFFIGLGISYGLAWTGHLFIEKNRPTTFGHPLWSFFSDFRMFFCFLSGRISRELKTHGVGQKID